MKPLGSQACSSDERDVSDALPAEGSGVAAPRLPLGTTTVMLRQISCHYSQVSLMEEVNDAGFEGTFDFFFMPVARRTTLGRGYAFINFVSAEWAQLFQESFHDRHMRMDNLGRDAVVTEASQQGLQANLALLGNTSTSAFVSGRSRRFRRPQHGH
eukprot:TRINITY_DN15033_c0_g1_i1.p1 TRINITY_DN15033_c0_g1~~TRINITY_DN15033_c0_g1_i1.p1  ORF type:complete len:156 (+),score=24.34 TRINITY_DN15033_c0_g1_i1:162-629(+)